MGNLASPLARVRAANLATGLAAGHGALLSQTRTLIAAMSVQPSAARSQVINALMVALLDSASFSRLDEFYAVCAHDAQAARLNWIAPGTNTLIPANSPTFTVDKGYAGDGLSAVLNSGLANNAASKYTQNDACIGVTVVAMGNGLADISTGSALTLINASNAGNLGGRANSTVTVAGAVPSALGTSHVQRTASNASAIYKNGVQIATDATAAAALTTATFRLLQGAGTFSSDTDAVGYVGASMTPTQIATLSAAIKTYINACTPGLLP